jgi:hypothetical protein
MSNPEKISPHGRGLMDRRNFMRNTGFAMGALGLTNLLASEDPTNFTGKSPIRPNIDPNNPYAPRSPHFDVPAKKVLVIFCPGAVSHVDTFDYKPELAKLHGKPAPFAPALTFEGPPGNCAKPFWDFKPRGQSGKMTSDLLPHLGGLVDDFCFIHSLHTQTSAHPQGENFLHTGFTMEGFPSFGAWATYALGSENSDLPAFVAVNDPRGLARSGKNNFGSGFLRPHSRVRISTPRIPRQISPVRAVTRQRMIVPPTTCSRASMASIWSATRTTPIWPPASPAMNWPVGCRPRCRN